MSLTVLHARLSLHTRCTAKAETFRSLDLHGRTMTISDARPLTQSSSAGDLAPLTPLRALTPSLSVPRLLSPYTVLTPSWSPSPTALQRKIAADNMPTSGSVHNLAYIRRPPFTTHLESRTYDPVPPWPSAQDIGPRLFRPHLDWRVQQEESRRQRFVDEEIASTRAQAQMRAQELSAVERAVADQPQVQLATPRTRRRAGKLVSSNLPVPSASQLASREAAAAAAEAEARAKAAATAVARWRFASSFAQVASATEFTKDTFHLLQQAAVKQAAVERALAVEKACMA